MSDRIGGLNILGGGELEPDGKFNAAIELLRAIVGIFGMSTLGSISTPIKMKVFREVREFWAFLHIEFCWTF
jgi:hypothetical protein